MLRKSRLAEQTGDSEVFLFKDEEDIVSDPGYVNIHPYLKQDSHPRRQVEIFGDSLQVVIRRAREINREVFDAEQFAAYKQELTDLKERQETLSEALYQVRDSTHTNARKKKFKRNILISKLKTHARMTELEQLINELTPKSKIDSTITSLVENLEKFGSTQLKRLVHSFESFESEISELNFGNICFYIGLISEYEHLKRHRQVKLHDFRG